MIVTVDINVLLDVFQRRQPHFIDSARAVDLVKAGKLIGVCPAHGLTTLYYLVRKHSSRTDAEAAMDLVLRSFQIGNLDAAAWRKVRQSPIDDFEDAVVAAVAEASASAFVITRNASHFARSPVPAITPQDFLSRFSPFP